MTITYSPAVTPEPETFSDAPPPAWWPTDRQHPVWCEGLHDLHPEDRVCWGPAWVSDALPTDDKQGEYLILGVSQRVTETTPKVWIGCGEGVHGRHLTAAQARKLADALLEAADAMESEA